MDTKKKFPPEVYSESEVGRLLRCCNRKCSIGARNRALVTVMYRAGLRISEVLDLRLVDVNFEEGTVRVMHGKGDRYRTVGIDEGGLAVVELWVERRKKLLLRSEFLFCTLKGGRLTEAYVRQLLPRLGKAAGIEKRIHAHGFRHSFAMGLVREGVPVNLISQALGHSTIATTWLYLGHLEPTAAIAAVRARRWDADGAQMRGGQKHGTPGRKGRVVGGVEGRGAADAGDEHDVAESAEADAARAG